MEEKLNEMEIGEVIKTVKWNTEILVTRVHGGWIYTYITNVGITSQSIPEPTNVEG